MGHEADLVVWLTARALRPQGLIGLGWAFSHSSCDTALVWWRKTKVPFLLPTTTSGSLSPLIEPTTTWVPTPESSSIRKGAKSTEPSGSFCCLSQ